MINNFSAKIKIDFVKGNPMKYTALSSRIRIMSRKAAEKLLKTGFQTNTAVITFVDPPDGIKDNDVKILDYCGICERYFVIRCYDLDPKPLEDYGLTVEDFMPEADQLAAFIKKAIADGLNIICQCGQGQSRSAACAAAILEYYTGRGIEIFADYRYYPNQLVFHKILESLRKK